MKKQILAGVFSAAVISTMPHLASAAFITINDNLQDNILVSSGSPVSGKFDIGALLVGNRIMSASFSVTATDDFDRVLTSRAVGGYNYSGSSYHYRYIRNVGWRNILEEDFVRTITQNYYDAAESSVVTFEGITETITASPLNHSVYTTGRRFDSRTTNHCHSSGFFGCTKHVPHNYYSRENNTVDGYWGSLSSSKALGIQEINAAMIDGLLDFQIAAASGDFILNSVTLTLETTPVPVPAAVWLFGSGLIGLLGVAKRRRA